MYSFVKSCLHSSIAELILILWSEVDILPWLVTVFQPNIFFLLYY